MKYNEVHTKSPLTPDIYEFTITQAYIENERMVLCHTVDTGPKAYQHVLERVPLRGAGLGRLKRMCESLNYVWVGDPDEQEFPLQFIKLRGRMKVDMTTDGNVIRNVITNWELSMRRPEYDVTKERTDEFFFQQKKPKKLPL